MPNAQCLIAILIAYLLGSIPFGLLITRMAGLGDIRKIGSGNIGATNVLRSGHKQLAALTLLLDGAKGLTAIVIARKLGADYLSLVALAAVLGHIFPVWLKFKGGKGVATAIGVTLGISPGLGASIIFIWLFVFYITRVSSLSALLSFGVTCLATPIAVGRHFPLMIILTALLCYTHRQNIQRLRRGTEPGFRKEHP